MCCGRQNSRLPQVALPLPELSFPGLRALDNLNSGLWPTSPCALIHLRPEELGRCPDLLQPPPPPLLTSSHAPPTFIFPFSKISSRVITSHLASHSQCSAQSPTQYCLSRTPLSLPWLPFHFSVSAEREGGEGVTWHLDAECSTHSTDMYPDTMGQTQ